MAIGLLRASKLELTCEQISKRIKAVRVCQHFRACKEHVYPHFPKGRRAVEVRNQAALVIVDECALAFKVQAGRLVVQVTYAGLSLCERPGLPREGYSLVVLEVVEPLSPASPRKAKEHPGLDLKRRGGAGLHEGGNLTKAPPTSGSLAHLGHLKQLVGFHKRRTTPQVRRRVPVKAHPPLALRGKRFPGRFVAEELRDETPDGRRTIVDRERAAELACHHKSLDQRRARNHLLEGEGGRRHAHLTGNGNNPARGELARPHARLNEVGSPRTHLVREDVNRTRKTGCQRKEDIAKVMGRLSRVSPSGPRDKMAAKFRGGDQLVLQADDLLFLYVLLQIGALNLARRQAPNDRWRAPEPQSRYVTDDGFHG